MIKNESFTVESACPDRLYVKTYHDFLDSTIINGKEKLIFILLKRYLNFKNDESGVSGTVYPTLDTLSKQSGMTKKTVIGILKKLESKGLIVVKQQGLNRPNIYTIRDFSGIWKAGTDEEVKDAIDMYEEEYEDSKIIEHLRNKGYTVVKEKELESEPTKAQNQALKLNQYDMVNTTTKSNECQVIERYTHDQIRQIFELDYILLDYPNYKTDVSTVENILYDVMNTSKPTVRIAGEDKPTTVVIGKLMKLDKDLIVYAIEKYHEHTGDVISHISYMRTVLYNAPEKFDLKVRNRINQY